MPIVGSYTILIKFAKTPCCIRGQRMRKKIFSPMFTTIQISLIVAKRIALFSWRSFANGMALMASNAITKANQLIYFGSILPLSVLFIHSASGEEKRIMINANENDEMMMLMSEDE